jgi:superfamily II DNA or RNA helicase
MSKLRPYQEEGEKNIFEAWNSGVKNVMFQLCTGGGKTVLFVDIIRKFIAKGKRVILIAHREELITQAWETLYRNEIYSGIIKADVKPNYSLPCQVASIQTIIRRKGLPSADLVIIDEAHHSQEDNTYGSVLMNSFPDALVLGVTATPYRLGGKGFTDVYEKLICSLSFKELVNQGYLAPIRYFVASRPNLKDVTIQKGDYVTKELEIAMGNAPLVESYLDHCNGMSGAVFAVNIEHSKKIIDQYNAAGISAAHLDANTPTEIRKRLLDRFKSGNIKIISNVGIITEGFDFPNMEFVQLARPTKSLSLYLQMIGRVTRISQGKSCGIVLDNASLFEEHGLPDQEFDWPRYFNGFDKKKKKVTEMIEMIEFVAEDNEGRVVRGKTPQEVEGLKLIEITHSVREKIIKVTSLKEFDKGLEMFKRMPKLTESKKAGFAAYRSYRDYCRKNNIMITDEMWDYIMNKLSIENEKAISQILSERDNSIELISQQYAHNPDDLVTFTERVKKEYKKREEQYLKAYVPIGYLKKEKADYLRLIKAA